ncbi:YitT family protein [Aquincola tertiaricarbonis]|uniref:YitT family protein n=1 Tax=Aquincola tertiaricarbonis TaxID=391953 RepID=A0ABY4SF27_AQUTE|nr:YitT family protein [Aquincola tertiaricarbonis]URI10727.1 YitT family protein [Aquincola tertiaricarbonis]
MASPTATLPPAERHTLLDDAQALLAGTLFVALGLTMYEHAGLITGGVAGAAFLLSYATGWSFGLLFFVLNLPFYWLAWKRLGPAFTFKTFLAIGLVSVFTAMAPQVVSFDRLHPVVAAVLGGILVGFGLLALLRHRASVGGVNILAQYLQERRRWSAGKVQLVIDGLIVLAAMLVLPPQRILLSVLGVVALSGVLMMNHRPGRYLGV